MIEQLLISIISVGIGILGTLVVVKLQFNDQRILNYCDVVLDGITQDTEMQKKVYLMGVLFGNGVKSGIGLTKGTGKFKMQDLIGMAFQHFLTGKQQTQASAPPLPWEKSLK